MTRGLHLLLGACCMLSLAAGAWAGIPSPLEISSSAERVAAWSGLRIVSPPAAQLTPEQAAELAVGGGARTVDGPNQILGRGTVPFWALFSMRNPDAAVQIRILSFEVTTQSDVRLFARDALGEWRRIKSRAEESAGRIGGGTAHPAWLLRLEPLHTTELLLRVEGPAVVRFPVFVHHPLQYAEWERQFHVIVGLALGCCIFIVVFIGSLRRYIEDISLPLFVGMLAGDLIGALWLSGFLSELFPGLSEDVLSPIGFAAYATLFGCGAWHARIYLSTATWAPRMDRLLLGLGWFWLALAPWFPLAFPVAARVVLVWGGLTVALVLVAVSLLAIRRRIRFSAYIAAAWLAYLLVGSAILLTRVVDNPSLWSSGPIALIQAVVIAVLFGLAMNQRLLRQRNALVAARQEAESRQQQEKQLSRERGLLFAATNHDLRQPLLGVGLFADLLKSARTDEERAEYAHKLDLALKEVDVTLIGIQQLAAVHEASHSPVMETAKLDDLLAPLIEEYRNRSTSKSITLRYVPSRLSITTHVPYFQRIVRNALSNAVRYTDHGDRILVGCRRGGGLRLVIADSGRGMSEEQTKKAFDAFQRFDTKLSIHEGFGLGLFSTKSLANALGIDVSLHSREGRGTEFRVSLSRSERPRSPEGRTA